MSNLIRRTAEPSVQTGTYAREPFQLMRQLLGWDPFAEMLPSVTHGWDNSFAPRFEVKETKDTYIFKADLPGVEERDLDIQLTGNRLTVNGKREAEAKDEGETYYAYERSYGTFSRSFTLPDSADIEHVDADLNGGVLTISIGKRPEHQPRKITLKGVAEKVKGAFTAKDKGTA